MGLPNTNSPETAGFGSLLNIFFRRASILNRVWFVVLSIHIDIGLPL